MNKIIISLVLSFAVMLSFSFGFEAMAQSSTGSSTLPQTGSGQTSPATGAKTLENPLGKVTSIQQLIGVVINYLMGVIGSIALVMFIIGGLIWLTSGGNSTKVQKGKDIIIWSALGMALIFSSYALVRFVLEIAK